MPYGPMEQHVVCKCPSRGWPLCGFCDDDRFCPQCGAPVAQVLSEHAHGPDGALLVYGDSDPPFSFSLSLTYHDRNREPRCGPPRLGECKIDPTNYFEEQVEVIGPRPDQRAMLVALKRRGNAVLPHKGLSVNFRAKGDFQPHPFKLLICRPPEFEVQLIGHGVLASHNWGENEWRIWKDGKLELELVIKTLTAPVCFEESLDVADDGTFTARLQRPLRAGEMLTPDIPCRLPLEIDASDWEIDEDRKHTLALVMPLACRPNVHTERHALVRVALGDLKFSSESLLIEHLHAGDKVSSEARNAPWMPLEVQNIGAEMLHLNPPEIVEYDPALGREWIQVAWRDSDAFPEQRPLDIGERAELRVEIDLTRVDLERMPADRPLAATILLTDELSRPWPLRLRIGEVRRLNECPHTVALDFGSTNSYAAVWDDGHEESGGGRLRPLLGLPTPEIFPSVIFFERADPQNPKYLIGREAAHRAGISRQAAVSGLKRWIGNPQAPRQHVRDREGGEASFDVATLVRLMLEEMLRHAEQTLKQVITRIGVTFPANFEQRRVDALRQILSDMQAARAAESPPRRLEFEELRVDEAIAVCLGFVLDPQNLEEHVQPLLQKTGRKSIIIGSFDFGGGTIDTALLRVKFEGSRVRYARLSSDFLGKGGDDQFGGDNVTMAVLEILRAKILELINASLQASGEPSLELPILVPTGSGREHAESNFKLLWKFADDIKLMLCGAKSSQELAESLALDLPTLQLVPAGDRQGPVVAANENAVLLDLLRSAGNDERFFPTLAQIYEHTVQNDLIGKGKYHARQRIQECVEQLASFSRRGAEPVEVDFLILAGASCRLPSLENPDQTLVEEMLGKEFPGARLIYDREHAKSKVAFGLARYLGKEPDKVKGLRPAIKYTGENLVWLDPGSRATEMVVPACSPVDDPDGWHPFPLDLQSAWRSDAGRKLPLYRQGRGRPQLIGYFDLRQPADNGETLPESVPEDAVALVRFDGAEEKLLAKVQIAGDRELGNWPLLPCDDERQLRS